MAWRLFRRRSRAPDESRSLTFQDVFGGGGDVKRFRGDAVETALSLVPVYAATRVLADGVASLPLQTFKERKGYSERTRDPAFIRQPTAHGTRYDWLHRLVTSVALRGNAFGYITGWGSDTLPTGIEWLDPDDVVLSEDSTDGPARWYVQGAEVPRERIVHIAGYTVPGKRLGLSPIGALKRTIETGLYAAEFGREWFENGSIPAAILQSKDPVSRDEAQLLKRRFKAAAQSRDPVVLANGLEYKPISVPADESQFIATLKLNATQIASIYGIPPEMIGGESGNSLTYANTEQQAINFVTYTLRPWLVRIETALSDLLPRGTFVRFNVDSIIRADTKTRYEAHSLAINAGWLSRNEVRVIEDRPPMPGGDFAPQQQGRQPAADPQSDGEGSG